MPFAHRGIQDRTPQFPGQLCRNGLGKEEPDVRPVPRARDFHGAGQPVLRASCTYRADIGLPVLLIEVERQESARFIGAQRVHSDDIAAKGIPSCQMVEEVFVRKLRHIKIRALGAGGLLHIALAGDPFVLADRGIAAGSRLCVVPAEGKHIGSG